MKYSTAQEIAFNCMMCIDNILLKTWSIERPCISFIFFSKRECKIRCSSESYNLSHYSSIVGNNSCNIGTFCWKKVFIPILCYTSISFCLRKTHPFLVFRSICLKISIRMEINIATSCTYIA